MRGRKNSNVWGKNHSSGSGVLFWIIPAGMKKGVTMTLEEIIALRDILNSVDLEAALQESIEEKKASKE